MEGVHCCTPNYLPLEKVTCKGKACGIASHGLANNQKDLKGMGAFFGAEGQVMCPGRQSHGFIIVLHLSLGQTD